MRIIRCGLARQGINVSVPADKGPHVPRSAKQSALDLILKQHGPLAVLRIGEGIDDLPAEPIALALLKASSLKDLLERWSRLSRFSHSRHQIAFQEACPNHFELQHQNKVGGPLPSPIETLLIVGVLTSLAEKVTNMRVDLTSESKMITRHQGSWHLDFQEDQIPGTILMTSQRMPLANTDRKNSLSNDIPSALRHRIKSDPLRKWTVEDISRLEGLSTRSLQRNLKAEGTSFSQLLTDTRLETSAELLCNRHGPGLAEIGFLSGFADQSHFTRTFTKSVGATPSSYRADFAD